MVSSPKINKKRVEDFLRELVKCNSENPPGHTTDVMLAVERICNENELFLEKIEYQPDKWVARACVEVPKSELPDFVITGHMDVVPVGDLSLWNFDPLGEDNEGYYYGRGSSDMKSGVALGLEMLVAVKETGFQTPFNLCLVLTSDEEVGLVGAIYIHKHTQWMKQCSYLVVTEPTDLQIACAEKGVIWFTVTARGQAAHASTPEKGKNAIEAIQKAIPVVIACIPTEQDGVLGKTTISLGMINGGVSPNVVPEQCTATFDVRYTTVVSEQTLMAQIRHEISKLEQETGCSFIIKVTNSLKVAKSAPDTPLVSALVKTMNPITGVDQAISVPYATDAAALIPGRTDVQFVIFGSGETASMHQPNERTKLKDLHVASRALMDTIVELSEGK